MFSKSAARNWASKCWGTTASIRKAQEFSSMMTDIQVAEARPGLLRRHDANQRWPDFQGHGRSRASRQVDGARRLHGGSLHRSGRAGKRNDQCLSPSAACRRKIRLARAKEFVDKYKASTAHAGGYAIYGYEAARWRWKRFARPARKIARRLSMRPGDQRFSRALGTWSFDENGDTTLTTSAATSIKDGKFEFVKLLGEDKQQKQAACYR